jgi:hypothetical protein
MRRGHTGQHIPQATTKDESRKGQCCRPQTGRYKPTAQSRSPHNSCVKLTAQHCSANNSCIEPTAQPCSPHNSCVELAAQPCSPQSGRVKLTAQRCSTKYGHIKPTAQAVIAVGVGSGVRGWGLLLQCAAVEAGKAGCVVPYTSFRMTPLICIQSLMTVCTCNDVFPGLTAAGYTGNIPLHVQLCSRSAEPRHSGWHGLQELPHAAVDSSNCSHCVKTSQPMFKPALQICQLSVPPGRTSRFQ